MGVTLLTNMNVARTETAIPKWFVRSFDHSHAEEQLYSQIPATFPRETGYTEGHYLLISWQLIKIITIAVTHGTFVM